MITDADTDALFLSDQLPAREPFWTEFTGCLANYRIAVNLLPHTRDIWCRDYMPVQVAPDRLVQFRYDPDYLRSKRWAPTRTDPRMVADAIGVEPVHCDLVIDGGNIVRGPQWVIMTDKIFRENRGHKPASLLATLERLLDARAIIIPREPYDYTGHADAMVRCYDHDTVLINRYQSDDHPDFQKGLRKTLREAGLRTIEVPYNLYHNASYASARGCYINFLQMKGFLLLPTFDLPEDDEAVHLFEKLFADSTVATLNANQIAEAGGVLNCVTWGMATQGGTHWPTN